MNWPRRMTGDVGLYLVVILSYFPRCIFSKRTIRFICHPPWAFTTVNSVKEVIFTRRLSVCLLATSRKSHWADSHENFNEDVSVDKEEQWHQHLDPDVGILWRILQRCKIYHFLQFGSYLWKKTDLVFIFILYGMLIIDMSLDTYATLNFAIHSDPESEFGSDLPRRRRSALCSRMPLICPVLCLVLFSISDATKVTFQHSNFVEKFRTFENIRDVTV